MTPLTQIQFEDENGQTFNVLVQSSEAVTPLPDISQAHATGSHAADDDEYEESMSIKDTAAHAIQQVKKIPLKAVHETIQNYTRIAIGAFQNLPGVEVEEVTLKFGISIEGTTGLPLITGGSAGANFEIEVKCKPKPQQP